MAPMDDPFKVNERVLCFHGQLLYEAKVIEVKPSDEKKGEKKYLIHYKGWKNTWDDWVSADRIRKDTEDNKELARNIKRTYDNQRTAANAKAGKRKGEDVMEDEKGATGRGKRGRNMEIETSLCILYPSIMPKYKSMDQVLRDIQRRFYIRTGRRLRVSKRGKAPIAAESDPWARAEEEFNRRPEVHFPIPDHVKSILVDDWEYVTKNQELVSLPSKTPITLVLEHYREEEKPKRRSGSADMDLLEEFIDGMIQYFNMAVGRILLYTNERPQYQVTRALWEKAEPGTEWDGKNAADVYGAEHLCRLMVKMPELVAQTNMDKQSIMRMREELTRLTMWLGRNSAKYFSAPYEKAPPEWVAKKN